MYNYKARVLNIVDGDTLDILIDLGFNITIKERVRLYGVDTPESRTRNLEEKKKGLAAKQFVKDWLDDAEVEITTEEKGKFGRYLAIIYVPGVNAKVNFNKMLITEGHAREYFGEKKKGWG